MLGLSFVARGLTTRKLLKANRGRRMEKEQEMAKKELSINNYTSYFTFPCSNNRGYVVSMQSEVMFQYTE